MSLEIKTETYDVGVLVGRFQVPELHDAHRALIRTVMERHTKVIVILGVSATGVTRKNPLDFQARCQMLLEEFPDLIIVPLRDMPCDSQWSAQLDSLVGQLTTPTQSVVMYGSRDSFLSHYSGRYPKLELLQSTYVSGSDVRDKIAAGSTFNSPAFRAGAIWAASCRFPTCYVAVDIAIFDHDQGKTRAKLLLARKPTDPKDQYRFIGGFLDPNKGASLENNAAREVAEEASNIAISYPQYVSSQIVDDWRYRHEDDKIMSVLFKADFIYGNPRPADDICELRWFSMSELKPETFVATHRPLYQALLKSEWK